MAGLLRIAKSSSEWTAKDMLAYNIRVSSQSPEMFYGQPLPTDFATISRHIGIDPNLLSGTPGTQGLSNETYRLLRYLDLASRPIWAVHDFAREILRALRYELRGLLLLTRLTIPLLISGDPNRSAQTDVCLVQCSSSIILIPVVEDNVDPEPKVIAVAIATFQYNNRIRARLGEHELDSISIPCITMTSTRPIFYLVPVSRELSEAVLTGVYPASTTVVSKCVAASKSGRLSEGMESPDFRHVALQHYVTFQFLAAVHWRTFGVPTEGEA